MPDERSRDETAKLRDIAIPAAQVQTTTVPLANDGTVAIQSAYSNALVMIGVAGDEALALFLLSAAGVAYEVSDPSGVFTAVKDTAASLNVYYETGQWILQNKRGAVRNVHAVLFRLAAPV